MAITSDTDSKNMKDMPHEIQETTMTDTEIEIRKDISIATTLRRTKTKLQVGETIQLLVQEITKPTISGVAAQIASLYS